DAGDGARRHQVPHPGRGRQGDLAHRSLHPQSGLGELVPAGRPTLSSGIGLRILTPAAATFLIRGHRCDRKPGYAIWPSRPPCSWGIEGTESLMAVATALTTVKPSGPEAAAGGAILAVDNIVKSFETPEGVVTAVDGVSLSVTPGEFVGVIGPSGC